MRGRQKWISLILNLPRKIPACTCNKPQTVIPILYSFRSQHFDEGVFFLDFNVRALPELVLSVLNLCT